MTTIVTGKRQLTVPAEIAGRLGIEAGTRVEWSRARKSNQVIITVQPSRGQLLGKIERLGRKYKGKAGNWAKEISEEREREDNDRIKELG